jgi:ADP-ribosylglycohydrolase
LFSCGLLLRADETAGQVCLMDQDFTLQHVLHSIKVALAAVPVAAAPALQGFLRTYGRGMRPPATGVDDAQADAVTRLPPLVALYAGDPRLMDLTAAVTRVTQDSAAAVAWACAAAAVLGRLVMGQGAAAAVEATMQELRQTEGGEAGAVSVRGGMGMDQQG